MDAIKKAEKDYENMKKHVEVNARVYSVVLSNRALAWMRGGSLSESNRNTLTVNAMRIYRFLFCICLFLFLFFGEWDWLEMAKEVGTEKEVKFFVLTKG